MRNKRGAALVEFALVTPLLFILLVGIAEFSLMLYDKAMLTNASREGARAGIVMANPRLSETEIKDIVIAYCGDHLINFSGGAPSPASPLGYGDVTVVGAQGSYPDPLSVTVIYQYNFLIIPRFIEALGLGPINLSAMSTMRME